MRTIAPTNQEGSAERVRLHITPFNPDLLDKIIPPSIQPLARNISFHTVHTFPERGFGFVELPAMEAQKIRKKLSGATLKGTKVRIEEARPDRKRKSDGSEDEDGARKAKKSARREKKRKEEGVVPGYELEEGRRVKRGWTERSASSQSSKKKDKSSKSSDNDHGLDDKKLRFKTSIPHITAPVEEKDKERADRQKRKDDKKHKKTAVVEEFGNSVKIQADHSQGANVDTSSLSYEDGKGWVNESGEVVEEQAKTRARKPKAVRPESERRISAIESKEAPDIPIPIPIPQTAASESNEDEKMSVDVPTTGAVVEPDPPKEVHPLEALFKRPANKTSAGIKPRPQPIDTSFSFFSGPAAEDEDMGIDMPPQTPHTKRDLEWRSIRSAAPTPDTAAIGRKFSFTLAGASNKAKAEKKVIADDASSDSDEDMADEDQADATAAADGTAGNGEESAFRKWFYENRGDLNRGWKKRRRDEKKAERQRENRRISRKAA